MTAKKNTNEQTSNTGIALVVILLLILIALTTVIVIKLYTQNSPKNDSVSINEQTNEIAQKLQTELAQTKEELEIAKKAIIQEVSNGVHVEQSTRNGNWKITVRYPEFPQTGIGPAFELQYPNSAPWGLMRIQYSDLSASGGDTGEFGPIYAAGFTLSASNYFAEGNKGMIFKISAAPKTRYYHEIEASDKTQYDKNNDLFLAEDNEYVYLYNTLNKEEDVLKAIAELLKSFKALNFEQK